METNIYVVIVVSTLIGYVIGRLSGIWFDRPKVKPMACLDVTKNPYRAYTVSDNKTIEMPNFFPYWYRADEWLKSRGYSVVLASK